MAGSSASAADIKITKSKFVYNGFSYFRAKAENIDLGSYGQKKTPIGQPNYLAVEDEVARANLGRITVKFSPPYDIQWSKYSSSAVNLGIKYINSAGGSASFSRNKAQSANLKLVKMFISEGPLKTLLNKHAGKARKAMASEGNDARIVSEVWIVVEAQMASAISTCGKVAGEGTVNGIKVTLSGSSCGTTKSSVTIPANTTFAYLMHKVKKWSKGKKQILNMEDDRAGLN